MGPDAQQPQKLAVRIEPGIPMLTREAQRKLESGAAGASIEKLKLQSRVAVRCQASHWHANAFPLASLVLLIAIHSPRPRWPNTTKSTATGLYTDNAGV